MDYRKTIDKLLDICKSGDIEAIEDLFQLCRSCEKDRCEYIYNRYGDLPIYDKGNFDLAHETSKKIRAVISDLCIGGASLELLDIYKKTLLFDAPHFLDAYCRYIEWNRDKEKRFYEPRRKQLKPIVDALQDLEDGKLDLLSVSCPPGVGKTTLAIFYLTWVGGRHPEKPILGGSHSNSFLKGVYDEIQRILDKDGEYLYNDVFPKAPMVRTDAKDMRIDLQSSKRFQTFEFSSIGSGNAGKVRAGSLLYCDDLVDGIETAMNKDRLDKLWQMYYTDLRQRKIGDCKELHIATRWSVWDVIGRLEQQYENDDRAKFIRFSATDENGESNYDYPYGLGFTTEYFKQQKEIMDDASYRALYMNEPIEREGRLYDPEELRYYFELPEREPDNIIAIVDTKEQGSDYAAMPVAIQYGEDFYIDYFLCDNGKVETIENRVAIALKEHKVKNCQIESNRGGTIFAENVRKLLKENGGFTNITTKWTQTNKETRIQATSGWIKNHFLFRKDADKEYKFAMKFLCGYTMSGKNKHDDVPDALSMLANYIISSEGNIIEVYKRNF